MHTIQSDVIFKIHQRTEEEHKEFLKPPENKWDERWLQIPTFLRRAIACDGEKKDTVSKPLSEL